MSFRSEEEEELKYIDFFSRRELNLCCNKKSLVVGSLVFLNEMMVGRFRGSGCPLIHVNKRSPHVNERSLHVNERSPHVNYPREQLGFFVLRKKKICPICEKNPIWKKKVVGSCVCSEGC